MDLTRLGSAGISAVIHAALMLSLAGFAGSAGLDSGKGEDQFNIEQGVALEGFGFGDAPETVQAVEQPPLEKVEATPPVPEVKSEEQPPEAITTASLDQKEEVRPRDPEPPKEVPPEPPKPETVQQEAVPEQVALATEQSSSKKQVAASPEASAKYRGEIYKRIVKNARAPSSRATGTVVLRFTVDPSGQLMDREIATSSGSKVLDTAALAALDRSAPYPAFAADVNAGPYTLTIPFNFTTR